MTDTRPMSLGAFQHWMLGMAADATLSPAIRMARIMEMCRLMEPERPAPVVTEVAAPRSTFTLSRFCVHNVALAEACAQCAKTVLPGHRMRFAFVPDYVEKVSYEVQPPERQ